MPNKSPSPARNKRGTISDDLNTMHTECVGLMGQSQVAADVLLDPVVHQHGDLNELTKLGKILQGDLSSFAERLRDLETQHPAVKTKSPSGDQFIQAAHVGMQYQEWLEEYQSIVIPIQMRIVNLGGAAHQAAVNAETVAAAAVDGVVPVSNVHTIP